MSRSTWKMPFSEVTSPLRAGRPTTKIWSRSSVILPHFVDGSFAVHNGKTFVPIKISEEMVGHKFGEFAITRRRPAHKGNKKRQVTRR